MVAGQPRTLPKPPPWLTKIIPMASSWPTSQILSLPPAPSVLLAQEILQNSNQVRPLIKTPQWLCFIQNKADILTVDSGALHDTALPHHSGPTFSPQLMLLQPHRPPGCPSSIPSTLCLRAFVPTVSSALTTVPHTLAGLASSSPLGFPLKGHLRSEDFPPHPTYTSSPLHMSPYHNPPRPLLCCHRAVITIGHTILIS